MAPADIWSDFQRTAREGLLRELKGGDPVLAALHVAAEDDAIDSKSTVALPVDAFSKRLDALVRQLQAALAAEGAADKFSSPDAAALFCRTFLFDSMGYTVAVQQLELYSPYRVYMHKVLSQRCGTPEALSVLLAGLIQRAQRVSLIPAFDVQLGLLGVGKLPLVRVVSDAQDSAADSPRSAVAGPSSAVEWISPREGVVRCLETLKRSYWSWVWNPRAPEAFVEPAEAFLGAFGRAGVGSGTVGVMQATGRPFGDLSMALLATERLAEIRDGVRGGRAGAREVRDTGILLCHLSRYVQAKEALEQYQKWLEEHQEPVLEIPANIKLLDVRLGQEPGASPEEALLIDRLLMKLTKLLLEETFQHS